MKFFPHLLKSKANSLANILCRNKKVDVIKPRSAQNADYYDSNLKGVMKILNESPWLSLYIKAAEFLPAPNDNPNILDIGCGTGRFARHLSDLGYKNYLGIDFSKKRIEEAKRYVPRFSFSVTDVLTKGQKIFSNFNYFVLLEILEHIENDCALLKNLPAGSNVILSVPNYLSKSHVRSYESIENIKLRYQNILDFENAKIHTIPRPKRPEKVIYLISCSRHQIE